ncbi:proteoglycan 4-like isoform X1 [Symsagittifera roscoffensis]|uniref:proteoglycan 4-like isoform X1 n=1 Tax=Symsagittifera roscoffensis TaxID=84072 RepID=UPI00307B2B5C
MSQKEKKKKGLFSRFKTAVFHADKPSGETKEDATATAEEPNNSQTKANKKEKKKDKREKSKEKKDVKGNSNQHSPTVEVNQTDDPVDLEPLDIATTPSSGAKLDHAAAKSKLAVAPKHKHAPRSPSRTRRSEIEPQTPPSPQDVVDSCDSLSSASLTPDSDKQQPNCILENNESSIEKNCELQQIKSDQIDATEKSEKKDFDCVIQDEIPTLSPAENDVPVNIHHHNTEENQNQIKPSEFSKNNENNISEQSDLNANSTTNPKNKQRPVTLLTANTEQQLPLSEKPQSKIPKLKTSTSISSGIGNAQDKKPTPITKASPESQSPKGSRIPRAFGSGSETPPKLSLATNIYSSYELISDQKISESPVPKSKIPSRKSSNTNDTDLKLHSESKLPLPSSRLSSSSIKTPEPIKTPSPKSNLKPLSYKPINNTANKTQIPRIVSQKNV